MRRGIDGTGFAMVEKRAILCVNELVFEVYEECGSKKKYGKEEG
jgi:hypothetical protein